MRVRYLDKKRPYGILLIQISIASAILFPPT